jgi:hypothetical protein
MKRGLAIFAIAASLFAPVAQANDALEAKVRAYVPRSSPSPRYVTSGSMTPLRVTTAPCSKR